MDPLHTMISDLADCDVSQRVCRRSIILCVPERERTTLVLVETASGAGRVPQPRTRQPRTRRDHLEVACPEPTARVQPTVTLGVDPLVPSAERATTGRDSPPVTSEVNKRVSWVTTTSATRCQREKVTLPIA